MAKEPHSDHRRGDTASADRIRFELINLLEGLGEHSRCAGRTAAAINLLDGYALHRPFQVVIPRGGNRSRVGHRVHTSTVLPAIDCEEVDGIRVTSPTRTLIDLAVTESTEPLTEALDGALRDGKTTETFLLERIAALRGRGRYGIPKLLAVIEGVAPSWGGHSWPERRFLELVSTARLPRPQAQTVLSRVGERLIRVDADFPGTPVVVEILGYRYHRTALQLQQDAVRLNRLQMDGFLVIQFTYWDVVQRPTEVIRTVIEALAIARTQPEPAHSVVRVTAQS